MRGVDEKDGDDRRGATRKGTVTVIPLTIEIRRLVKRAL